MPGIRLESAKEDPTINGRGKIVDPKKSNQHDLVLRQMFVNEERSCWESCTLEMD